MEAFQLRLWDGRIGRWLTTDPKHQYASPYLGMGNNPVGLIDPDGGETNDWYRNNITGGYTWYDSSDAIDGFTHLGVDFLDWNPITLDYSYAFDKNTVFDSSGSAIAFNLGGLKDVVIDAPRRGGNSSNYLFPLSIDSNTFNIPNHQAGFGYNRGDGRLHGGIDLYAPVGTYVIAITDGNVVRDPYPFKNGSYAVEVNHGSFTIRYGEIRALNTIRSGSPILRGDTIGTIMKMRGIKNTMLHIEMYSNNANGALTNRNNKPYQRRTDLINPTNFINSIR